MVIFWNSVNRIYLFVFLAVIAITTVFVIQVLIKSSEQGCSEAQEYSKVQKSSETQRWSEVFVSLFTYLLMLKFLSSACQGCIKSCAFIWKAGKESADGNDSDKRKRMNKTSEELGIIVDTGIKSVLVLCASRFWPIQAQ